MDCIFCKIINGEIPSCTVYEDEIVKVFLDIHPEANGHMLIIPKKHILNLDDMDMDTLNHIMKIAKKMKKLLEERLHIDGLTLIQNNGVVQEVKHYHLHLKPYYINKQAKKDIKDIYEILS
mgnify:CR=1 FL=1